MECCGFGQLHQSDRAKFEPSKNGHSAFDLYRADTLQRLEQEQKDFQNFVGRLRAAKDKAEFDQFMTERRNRSAAAVS